MPVNAVIIRYTRALYQAAEEQQILDPVKRDLAAAHAIFAANTDLDRFLRSPSVSRLAKQKVLQESFHGQVADLVLTFWQLLLEKNRQTLIAQIYPVFEEIHRKAAGIYPATITYAAASAAVDSKKMNEFVKNSAGLPQTAIIELNVAISPELIGGFVLCVDNKYFDYSLKGQLERLKNDFNTK